MKCSNQSITLGCLTRGQRHKVELGVGGEPDLCPASERTDQTSPGKIVY